MASLAISALGAYVGDKLGYAAVGWMLGSLLGNILLLEKEEKFGPRITELRLSGSAEGEPILIVYGTNRIAGNIIWLGQVKEVSHTYIQESKGKSDSEYTSYTYFSTFALALCEGPIVGIRRIWMNSILVYDASETATAEALIKGSESTVSFNVHFGSDAQLPDSIIESYEGVGEVPAFRGISYIVFEDLLLTDFGNAIPNMEVEVMIESSETYEIVENVSFPAYEDNHFHYNNSGVINYLSSGFANAANVTLDSHLYAVDGTFIEKTSKSFSYSGNPGGSDYIEFAAPVRGVPNLVALIVGFTSGGHSGVTWAIDETAGITILREPDGTELSTRSAWPTNGVSTVFSYGDAVYLIRGSRQNEAKVLLRFDKPVDLLFNPTATAKFTGGVDGIASFRGMYVDSVGVWLIGDAIVSGGKCKIYLLSHDLTTLVDSWDNLPFKAISSLSVTRREEVYRAVYASETAGTWQVVELTSGGTSVDLGDGSFAGSGVSIQAYSVAPGLIFGRGGYASTGVYARSPVSVSTVVSNVCERAGLTALDYDVSSLTDNVRGYMITHPMAGVAVLGPLLKTHLFDMIESGGKLEGIARGTASPVTIPDIDLGAGRMASSSDKAFNLTSTRQSELELPVELHLIYHDQDLDYGVGEQYARRLTKHFKGT